MSNIDILPTLVAAAGGAPPTDRIIDGVNLMPLLGKDTATLPSRPLFWRDGSYRAVQDQGWKLIVSEDRQDKAPGRPVGFLASLGGPGEARAGGHLRQWLFDLQRDPTEQHNLAAQQPQQRARLEALLRAHNAQMPAPLWPSFLQLPVAIDKTLEQKESASDEYTYWIN